MDILTFESGALIEEMPEQRGALRLLRLGIPTGHKEWPHSGDTNSYTVYKIRLRKKWGGGGLEVLMVWMYRKDCFVKS